MSHPTKQPLIPVGKALTLAEFSKFTQEQLANREILDPRYAGFDAHFNWSNHITVNIKDPVFRAEITGSLDQFAKTAEGQHTIRQAAVMEAYRKFGTLELTSNQRKLGRVAIIDGYRSSYELPSIWMNRKDMQTHEYLGTDNKYHKFSVQHVLFHELLHAADGLLTEHNGNIRKQHNAAYCKAQSQDDCFNYKKHQSENPVVHATNHFVPPHYGEIARKDFFSVRDKSITLAPVAPTEHYHDHMLASPTTPQGPKNQRQR